MMKFKTCFVLLLGLHFGFLFMNIPPSIEKMMEVYRIGYTQMGVLVSAFLWTHTLLQIPGGMIVDRVGTRLSILAGLIFMLLGSILPLISADFGLAVLGRVLIGIGTGASFIACMKLITLFAGPERSGFYQALFGGSFSLGNITAYGFIPLFVRWGWRWVYIPSGMLCIPLIALLLMLRVEDRRAGPSSPLSFGKILRHPTGWVLGAYHAISYGSILTLGNWVPSLLADLWGYTAAQLAWGGVVIMSIGLIGRVMGGFLLKRLPAALIANGSILVLLFLLILFQVPVPGVVLVVAFLMAWFAASNFGAFWQIAGRSAPDGSVGTLFGFINFLANLGTVFFTLTFGWVKDQTGTFSLGFGVLAVFTALSLMAGFNVIRRNQGS